MIWNWYVIYGTILDGMQQTLSISLLCFLCEPRACSKHSLEIYSEEWELLLGL